MGCQRAAHSQAQTRWWCVLPTYMRASRQETTDDRIVAFSGMWRFSSMVLSHLEKGRPGMG